MHETLKTYAIVQEDVWKAIPVDSDYLKLPLVFKWFNSRQRDNIYSLAHIGE